MLSVANSAKGVSRVDCVRKRKSWLAADAKQKIKENSNYFCRLFEGRSLSNEVCVHMTVWSSSCSVYPAIVNDVESHSSQQQNSHNDGAHHKNGRPYRRSVVVVAVSIGFLRSFVES